MPKKKKIRNPWCIYRHGTPTGIGKILIEYKTSALVLHCEVEGCTPEVCGKKDLRRFTTITAAVKEFNKYSGCTLEQLKGVLMLYFPSNAKEIIKIKE